MFEEQVAKTPDRIALSACDGKLTYKELDRLANITANSLIEKGLEKGGKVLILLERTSKFFISLFGILKAGGAFIPSCPDYPKERIDSIIENSDADFVITDGELLGVYDRTVDVSKLLSGNNEENPNVDVQPDDLAYLIYTSGSTGKPKGVMLRHIGIANYLAYSDSNIQVKEVVDNCHAYGSVTTISFDMSLKETMLSLCNGLTLVFASEKQTVNPMLLAEFFKENNVDAFNSTPSRLLQYMELDEFAEAMANCKVILSGGEKYPDKLLRILREKTNATIINTYGPTEITVSSNAKILRMQTKFQSASRYATTRNISLTQTTISFQSELWVSFSFRDAVLHSAIINFPNKLQRHSSNLTVNAPTARATMQNGQQTAMLLFLAEQTIRLS